MAVLGMLGSSTFFQLLRRQQLQLTSTSAFPIVKFGAFKKQDRRSLTTILRCLASGVQNTSNFSTMKQKQVLGKDDEDETEDDEGKKERDDVEAEFFEEIKGSYPNTASFLEGAFKDDREIQEIMENSFEDPEEMGKRVSARVKRKEKEILQTKTGSPVPMKVSFYDFDPTDSYIWMELYDSPSEKDIDIIGSVIRSWYLLGCLGGYNSFNMQLTRIPVNERLSYKEYVEDDFLPARFLNIGELEFQHNLGRFWVDLGTSEPLALDFFVNAFIAISSDYVGIKELTFGGKVLGNWNEQMKSQEEGLLSFKI